MLKEKSVTKPDTVKTDADSRIYEAYAGNVRYLCGMLRHCGPQAPRTMKTDETTATEAVAIERIPAKTGLLQISAQILVGTGNGVSARDVFVVDVLIPRVEGLVARLAHSGVISCISS